jgi:hypothetical protein
MALNGPCLRNLQLNKYYYMVLISMLRVRLRSRSIEFAERFPNLISEPSLTLVCVSCGYLFVTFILDALLLRCCTWLSSFDPHDPHHYHCNRCHPRHKNSCFIVGLRWTSCQLRLIIVLSSSCIIFAVVL